MRLLFPLLLLTVPARTAPIELEFGRFVITVSDSWTAQVFHIVDQLSQWDQYAHKAYMRWARTNLVLDAEDKRLLEQHASMRKARGWGNGFEQAFLVEGSIQAAADQAVEQKLLTAEQAASERTILLHFAPKLEKLRDQHRLDVELFQAKLQSERTRLTAWFDKLIRFTQTTSRISASVFLVVNPEEKSGGGEANGGRIVIEVPSPGPMGTLFHESLHVLLASRAGDIKAAAERASIPVQVLHEAVVYALSPGLTDNPAETDQLSEQLARFLTRGTPASDSYAQFYMMAAIIRPVLRASIDAGETFSDFLPKAVARWRAFSPP